MSPDAKIKKENYLECPACTKELGERIVYPKYAMIFEEDLFGEAGTRCPRGHSIEEVKP